MKNHSFILIIIIILCGIFLFATKSLIRRDNTFPDQRGTLSPTSRISKVAPSKNFQQGMVSEPQISMHSVGAIRTKGISYSSPRGGYLSSSVNSHSTTTVGRIGHLGSSAAVHSVGGGYSSATNIRNSSSRQSSTTGASSLAYSGISSVPSVSYNKKSSSHNFTQDNSTSAAAASQLSTMAPFSSTTSYLMEQYQNPLYNTVDQSLLTPQTTRRRSYTGNAPTDGNGNYWDEEEEEWLPIPGSSTTPQIGDTKVIDGNTYVYNGTTWVLVYQPGDDEYIDPGLPGMENMWKSLFIAENGYEPSDDELADFINQKLGTGIYTGPLTTPLWFILLLVAAYIIRISIRRIPKIKY